MVVDIHITYDYGRMEQDVLLIFSVYFVFV